MAADLGNVQYDDDTALCPILQAIPDETMRLSFCDYRMNLSEIIERMRMEIRCRIESALICQTVSEV